MKNFLFNIANAMTRMAGTGYGEGEIDDFDKMAEGIGKLVKALLGPILTVIGVAAVLYSIYLGVMYAKAESADKRKEVQGRLIGAIIGAAVLYLCTSTSGDAVVGTGANACQPGVSVAGGLVAEIVFTFVFVLVVLGTTDAKKGAGNFAGLAIGLSLVLVHLVCIRYTGTSVNPARSIGPALFQGGEALSQLWIFIVGPFVGGALAALVWKAIGSDKK